MDRQHHMVPLGFTADHVPAGTHICQIYSDDDDGLDSLLQFMLSGLQSRERTACFSERVNEPILAAYLEKHRLSCAELTRKGDLMFSGTEEIYFHDNRFDPDRMLAQLVQFYDEAMASGHCAARVIGEMSPDVQKVPGGERLMEYESRVSQMLEKYPVTAVCQYDARKFDGATLMDILKVHPMMVVRGTLTHNPFFIQPEEFLS